jgi:hypothetical protein
VNGRSENVATVSEINPTIFKDISHPSTQDAVEKITAVPALSTVESKEIGSETSSDID